MAQNVKLYNLLISCPGDIKEEVTLIESAVDEFNELYAETLGITIKTRHWSKSSYAQSGGKPQALLNEQFVNKCDAAVAIFWTRFGSPTDEYGSGTEEEIEIMLQSGTGSSYSVWETLAHGSEAGDFPDTAKRSDPADWR